MSGSFTPVLPSEGDYDVEPGEEPVPWGKVIRSVVVVAAIVAVIAFVIVPGYSAGQDAQASDRIEECTPVPATLRSAIGAKADPDVTLTAWAMSEAVDVPGMFLVSAEVRESRLVDASDGEIATWVTADPGGLATDFAVMDPIAREFSTWPDHDGSVAITDEGAIASRFCTSKLRDDRWLDDFPEFR